MKWPRGRVHSAIIFPALLLTMGMPADVLAQNLSGDWDVRWAQAVRVNRDGTVEIQSWGSADLSLVQRRYAPDRDVDDARG